MSGIGGIYSRKGRVHAASAKVLLGAILVMVVLFKVASTVGSGSLMVILKVVVAPQPSPL